jgi:hypothetical protein
VGFAPDAIRVQVLDKNIRNPQGVSDIIFSLNLPGNATSFTIPDTVLSFDTQYVLRIQLIDLTSHIPDRGTHLVHYYGAYSNAHRGVARKREIFLAVPPEDEPPDPPRPDSAWLTARRKSWARLIRRVYEVDPLLCPCGQRMRVVGFIAQAPVIRKILTHIGRRFDPLKLPDPSPDYGPQ